MTGRRFFRVIAWTLAGLIAAAAVWLLATGNPLAPGPGAPFSLIDQEGRNVTERDFRGRPYGIYFGYTRCPDVCPTTLSDYQLWRQALGPAADGFRLVFVTVDPARDTPQMLKGYLASFSDSVIGLSGSEEAIADIVRRYGIYRRKVPGEDGDYTVDHTATVFLIDRHGRFFGKILYQEATNEALAKLRALLAAP